MSRVLPILFNTDMVQAILKEPPYNKTETRRTIKGFIPEDAIWEYSALTPKGYISCRGTFPNGYGEKFFRLPCQQGDTLYIRETWRKQSLPDGKSEIQYRADFTKQELECYGRRGGCAPEKWSPSIHMPKAAARIWLKVTDVRPDRLHNMTGQDILKEGVNSQVHPDADYFDANQKEMFAQLWNSTIQKGQQDLYSWDANPWVWVISFEQCKKPESNDKSKSRRNNRICL